MLSALIILARCEIALYEGGVDTEHGPGTGAQHTSPCPLLQALASQPPIHLGSDTLHDPRVLTLVLFFPDENRTNDEHNWSLLCISGGEHLGTGHI